MSDRAAFIARLPKHSIGAEIGVWKGDFSAALLEGVEPEHLTLVDPWEKNNDHTNYSATVANSQQHLDNVCAEVCERFDGNDSVEILRVESAAAARENTRKFDWVYIDARHDESHVTEDLAAWWPHIKPSGMLCGHDHNLQQVRVAVARFCEQHGVEVEIVQDVNFVIEKPLTEGDQDE